MHWIRIWTFGSTHKKMSLLNQSIPLNAKDTSTLPSLSGYLQQKAGFFGRWKKYVGEYWLTDFFNRVNLKIII